MPEEKFERCRFNRVRQGCLLSPILFNIILERIMTDALEDDEGTVSIGGRTITNLRSAEAVYKQHQWHQHRDQSKWTEA